MHRPQSLAVVLSGLRPSRIAPPHLSASGSWHVRNCVEHSCSGSGMMARCRCASPEGVSERRCLQELDLSRKLVASRHTVACGFTPRSRRTTATSRPFRQTAISLPPNEAAFAFTVEVGHQHLDDVSEAGKQSFQDTKTFQKPRISFLETGRVRYNQPWNKRDYLRRCREISGPRVD